MNWKQLSDRELVEACVRDNQHEAWVEFLRRFQRLIAGVIIKTVRRWMPPDRNLVEDLVQDTLLKVCKNDFHAVRDFEWLHENSFRGFLKVVASNVVQDHFRKHPTTRVEEELEEAEPLAATGWDPSRNEGFTHKVELEALMDKLVNCLRRVLKTEPDCNRNVIIFRFYFERGYTARELSQLYSLTIKGVENTLLRLVRIAKAQCLKQRQAGQG